MHITNGYDAVVKPTDLNACSRLSPSVCTQSEVLPYDRHLDCQISICLLETLWRPKTPQNLVKLSPPFLVKNQGLSFWLLSALLGESFWGRRR